ncbi:hypothetical protein H4219_005235 [Mycoemilia scoparia]|uniref:Uncharacterized protein n=1 Tax=Mycoemilia scoparia TaxID=417184 RepID=A0A9W8DLH6_9FUNG|nr:hypothetical protein H4219_005235 [Mycoemilia scoparia]
MTRILKQLHRLDAFPKVEGTYQARTVTGGILSFIVAIILGFMVVSEFHDYLQGRPTHEFFVDHSIGKKIQINIDMTVAMPCAFLRVDLFDEGGAAPQSYSRNVNAADVLFSIGKAHNLEQDSPKISSSSSRNNNNNHKGDVDANHNNNGVGQVFKQAKKRVGINKNQQASNVHSGDSKYRVNPGCRIYGNFLVNKVAGNLHVTAHGHGHGGPHVPHEYMNFTHRIDEFSFGKFYPGIINPLDDTYMVTEGRFTDFRYHLSVIPTLYMDRNQRVLETDQYAVKGREDKKYDVEPGSEFPPGVFFEFDIEPISVKITERGDGFAYFMVKLCSATGGIFVTVGLAHRLFRRLTRHMLFIGGGGGDVSGYNPYRPDNNKILGEKM